MDVQYHKLNALSYQNVWDFQTLLHNDIKNKKSESNQFYNKDKLKFLNHLIFCEHLPVFTLGKSASISNLISSGRELNEENIEFFKINRGGDITYHGPGQITGYLIFDLEQLYRDVHRFVRSIEECIIKLLEQYGLKGFRIKDYTGVWLGNEDNLRKICAIGVHLSRWVSMHGFAFNVNTNLNYFEKIIPCGINEENKSVTNLANELGRVVDFEEVQLKLKNIIKDVFDLKYID